MTLPPFLCSLLHRRHWRFIARKETGPSLFGRQHHVGIYECEVCHARRRIVGGPLCKGDANLTLDARPPVRGVAMRLHQLLGGPV